MSILKQKALLDIFNEDKREQDQKRKAQQEEARTNQRAHPIIDKGLIFPTANLDCNASVGSSNPYNLGVATVQVASVDYGVIRWTGRVAGVDGQVAGIELVSSIIISIVSSYWFICSQEDYLEGCSDGTFKLTGEKHFTCAFGRGLYLPLTSVLMKGLDLSLHNTLDLPRHWKIVSVLMMCTLHSVRTVHVWSGLSLPYQTFLHAWFCIL